MYSTSVFAQTSMDIQAGREKIIRKCEEKIPGRIDGILTILGEGKGYC